jgi:hypothetical protein
MDTSIAVTRDGAIATVVLNRPDKLNALTKAMWRPGLAIGALSAGDDLRCIICAVRSVFAGQRHRRLAAREQAQAIGYGAVMRATRRFRRVPPSAGRADPRDLSAADRRVVRSADLRRVEPVRRPSEPGARDGVRGVGRRAARGPRRGPQILLEGRIFDAAGAGTRDSSRASFPDGKSRRARRRRSIAEKRRSPRQHKQFVRGSLIPAADARRARRVLRLFRYRGLLSVTGVSCQAKPKFVGR